MRGGDWVLVELTPPPPPFDSIALGFVAAWGASDVEAMARFSPREKWETMTAAIGRMAERRDWREFPSVEEATIETLASDQAEVRLALADGGAAFVRWKVGDDDSWILTSIKPPAR